jgi:phospholipid/cholesterol/gamma-HCH transport system substrate-binding protein
MQHWSTAVKSGVEIKVGIFVLIACLVLVFMTIKVGPGIFLPRDTYEVDVFFNNVAGLRTNAPVEIAGIEVGLVQAIRLEDNRARVTLMIYPNVRIRADASAIIRTRGVIGDRFVEIVPGSEAVPVIGDGGRIVYSKSPADMDMLFAKVGEIAEDIRLVARSTANVFGGPQGEQDLRLAFESLRDAAVGLNAMVQTNAEIVEQVAINFRNFSADLRDISRANKDGIERIVTNLDAASQELKGTLEQTRIVLSRIEGGEGALARLVNDPAMGQDLRETMASLESVSRRLDEGQGTLGRLIHDEAMADELNRTLEGLNEHLLRQERFQVSVDFSSEYLARHGETKSYLTLRLQPSENKYYLLSLVNNPMGVREKTETFTERWINGQRTTIREIRDKYYRNKISFSAQMAKRWDNLVLRGGLFESTGGVGLDYFLWDDRLQLLFETFDFGRDDTPHLKAGARLHFLENFYASIGLDDFAHNDRRSFYAGLGFHFTDEDLKHVLARIPIPGD